MTPLALTDAQMAIVADHAATVPPSMRPVFALAIADGLAAATTPVTDAMVTDAAQMTLECLERMCRDGEGRS